MAHLPTVYRIKTKRGKYKRDSYVFLFFPLSFSSILSITRIAQAFVVSNLRMPQALKPVSHLQFGHCRSSDMYRLDENLNRIKHE